jgi:hypothetical protein
MEDHMTARRTKPAADEAACPVAPLAREYAQLIRAQRTLHDEAEAKALLACTETIGEVGPLSAPYADKLLLRRKETIDSRARMLRATSRFGIAFQMLLAHTDYLESNFTGDTWQRVPREVRELTVRLDTERQGMIWTAYKAFTADMRDPDLVTIESIFGREGLTDAECVERVLKAVA